MLEEGGPESVIGDPMKRGAEERPHDLVTRQELRELKETPLQSSEGTNPADTLISTSGLQRHEGTHICCFRHPVGGAGHSCSQTLIQPHGVARSPFCITGPPVCSPMALTPPSNVFRMADMPFPATLSVRGARFFIGSRRRTKGRFTVRMEALPPRPSNTSAPGGCHHWLGTPML